VGGYALGQPYGYGAAYEQVFVGTSPAAGSNFVQVMDSRYVWVLVGIVFTLTTDANVANRYVTVEYAQDGQNPYAVSAAGVLFTAGGVQRYVGAINRGVAEWNTGTDVLFPLAAGYLRGGSSLTVRVGAIQVGDTLTKIVLTFDKYPTDVSNVPGEQV
jgi:hypothetical protein